MQDLSLRVLGFYGDIPVWFRPAELVAKFMDERLRGGQKGQSDEELDSTLDKALMLFRYIQVRNPVSSHLSLNRMLGPPCKSQSSP